MLRVYYQNLKNKFLEKFDLRLELFAFGEVI